MTMDKLWLHNYNIRSHTRSLKKFTKSYVFNWTLAFVSIFVPYEYLNTYIHIFNKNN